MFRRDCVKRAYSTIVDPECSSGVRTQAGRSQGISSLVNIDQYILYSVQYTTCTVHVQYTEIKLKPNNYHYYLFIYLYSTIHLLLLYCTVPAISSLVTGLAGLPHWHWQLPTASLQPCNHAATGNQATICTCVFD